MRYYLPTLLLLFVNTFTSNAQFSDDFSDGDFTNSPTWLGQDTSFEVASQVLHLNTFPASDTSSLVTASSAINNAVWEFYVELDFNPSSSNLARIYLTSSSADLNGNLNGYFVMVGNSDDEISLYRQDGTATTKIIDGADGTVNLSFVTARVQVTRDASGNWELLHDVTGGTAYTSEGTIFDDTHPSSQYFGVHCKYTSTRSDKFYFDDFNVTGSGFVDVVAPQAISAVAIGANSVDIQFDEPLNQVTAETAANYTINGGIGTPSTATLDGSDPSLVHLNLATSLTVGNSYTVDVSGVEDLAGNVVANTQLPFIYVVVSTPSSRDVIFTEFLPDPSPQVGLPDAEYLEIFNATASDYFDLAGWEISDGTSTVTLPSIIMAPGDYIAFCDDSDSALFTAAGYTVIGVSSFPSLNNASDNMTLTDGANLIDAVNYEDTWYNDANKDDGGYSLELINPTKPCSDASNWSASNDNDGGTPGMMNSIADFTPDTSAPAVVDYYIHSSDSIRIQFSEALDATALGSLSIMFSDGNGYLESIDANNPAVLWLQVSTPFAMGASFTVDIDGIQDCSGNVMIATQLLFQVPEPADSDDIVINEILFNPGDDGADFVEIYNLSDKVISLRDWYIADWDDGIANEKLISSSQLVINPKSFLVLTEDSSAVKLEHPNAISGTFVQIDLPSYTNDSSTVYILDDQMDIMDKFSYTEDMHFDMLQDLNGVSLERIDYLRPSDDVTNWHSAAETVGFATPGFENSQYNPVLEGFAENNVVLSPDVFSPDNDGYQDVLNISYAFDEPGYVASIAVYDLHGRLIKTIAQNLLLEIEGVISWDGLDENMQKAVSGPYVLYFEVFNLSGVVDRFKKPCAVATRF